MPNIILSFFEIGFNYITQAGLKLLILLLWIHECWDYRNVSLNLVKILYLLILHIINAILKYKYDNLQ
jgi:hypothetical protein